MLISGFQSLEHEAKFRTASKQAGRSGAGAKFCGARTRSGATCRHPPLRGGRRCLRHAGPHAARAYRDRQLDDLALGRITFDAFSRSEAKRAVNRLRWTWRKNPWHPGATIDLGPHEDRFLSESGVARLGVRVAPAVLDWLRWRYRRLRIDRKRDEEWLRVLREDYPRRVREAGPPLSGDDGAALTGPVAPPLWQVDRPSVTSKRQRLDVQRPTVEPQPRQLRERAMSDELDHNALGLMVAQHRDTLAPLLDRCRSEGEEQRTLILALHDYLNAPDDAASGRRWRDAVTELWSRGQ